MKTIKVNTFIKVKTLAGRIRHAQVMSVTNQTTITARIGHGTIFNATSGTSTPIRGTIFSEI